MAIRRSLTDWLAHRACLIDSNLLIFHPDNEEHRNVLNRGAGTVDEQKQLCLHYREDILAFYQWWCDYFKQQSKRLFITRMQLDLELSGWTLIQNNPKRYRSRFANRRMPRGHLVRDHDVKTTKKAKNRLIQQLSENHTVNDLLKSRAKGLRRQIRDLWLARPIWQAALKKQKISGVDEDLLVNLLALSCLKPTTLVSKDRALRTLVGQVQKELRNESWAKSPEERELSKRLSSAQFECADYEGAGQSMNLVFG